MKQRILAVDDEVHMLTLLEHIIREKTPYDIVTTNNALGVPSLLANEEFDLLITDLKMPSVDGMDLLRLAHEQGPEEVIIITAFGSIDSALEARVDGVSDYLTKPFRKEQLLFAVDRAMRRQAFRREALESRAMFETEPYQTAAMAFKREYLRRLRERCGGEAAAMSERSGLTAEDLEVAEGNE